MGRRRAEIKPPSRRYRSKNRSAMRTRGLMVNFISFGWNAVLKYQHLGVATSEKVDKSLQFLKTEWKIFGKILGVGNMIECGRRSLTLYRHKEKDD